MHESMERKAGSLRSSPNFLLLTEKH